MADQFYLPGIHIATILMEEVVNQQDLRPTWSGYEKKYDANLKDFRAAVEQLKELTVSMNAVNNAQIKTESAILKGPLAVDFLFNKVKLLYSETIRWKIPSIALVLGAFGAASYFATKAVSNFTSSSQGPTA